MPEQASSCCMCPVLCWHAELCHANTRLQELKRQQEEEQARQEEARLAAEQAHLAAQFQSEQDAERGRRSTKEQEQQQGAPSGSRLGGGGGELQTSKSEGRRRVSGEWCVYGRGALHTLLCAPASSCWQQSRALGVDQAPGKQLVLRIQLFCCSCSLDGW